MESKDKKNQIIAKNILKRILADKNLKDNDSFDSEYALSVQYGTTRVTVRKAIEFLVNANVLYKIPRKGVYIKSILAAELFAEQLEQHGNSLLNNVTISDQKEKIIVFANPCYDINFSNMDTEQTTPFAHKICTVFRKYTEFYPCNFTFSNAESAEELLEEKNLVKLRKFGLLYIAPYNRDLHIVEKLIAEGVKVMLIDSGPWPDNVNYIYSDENYAGVMLGDYIFKLGHERVCYFHRPYSNTAMSRLNGIIDSAKKHNVDIEQLVLIDMNDDTFNKLKKHVKGPSPPTVIIANSQVEYFKIFKLVNDCGYAVPEDISLCAYGDTDFLCFQEVPVTAVQHPTEEVVFLAIDKLLSMKKSTKDLHIVDISLRSKLNIRESVTTVSHKFITGKKVSVV